MLIYIRNMVCVRCVMAVETVLNNLNIAWENISMGQAIVSNTVTSLELSNLDKQLRAYHLELMHGKKQILTERIKILINELLQNPQLDTRVKLSWYLANKLNYDYTYLSNVFSEQQNSSIEKYFIVQRVERVKELMIYEQLSVTQIAEELQFSSVSHLCVQFRKVAGQTPANFKKQCLEPGFQWRKVHFDEYKIYHDHENRKNDTTRRR